MMQKGQHDQSKVNVAYSYASEQGLQQKATAPNPPTETQLADPLSFMAKARWFALGLLGGIFAMIVKLALSSVSSQNGLCGQALQSIPSCWLCSSTLAAWICLSLACRARRQLLHMFPLHSVRRNQAQRTFLTAKRLERNVRAVFCGSCLVFVEA